jgi:hypothetical protein
MRRGGGLTVRWDTKPTHMEFTLGEYVVWLSSTGHLSPTGHQSLENLSLGILTHLQPLGEPSFKNKERQVKDMIGLGRMRFVWCLKV